jgi:hypothetical protein
MNLSEKFRRFAAECEAMSKCAKSYESKASWDGMAARWLLFAELADDRYSRKENMTQRRQRRSRYSYLN